jgi:hypothetical protein
MYEGPHGQVAKGYMPALILTAVGVAVTTLAVWLL